MRGVQGSPLFVLLLALGAPSLVSALLGAGGGRGRGGRLMDAADPPSSLARLVERALGESYAGFALEDSSSWSASSSTDTASDKDGSWMLRPLLGEIQANLAQLQLNHSSEAGAFLCASPTELCVPMHCGPAYDLTLLHLPPGERFPARYHAAGAIIMYRRLYGKGCCRRIIVSREVDSEALEDALLTRLGGMRRVLESAPGSALGVLELVLYPPSRVREGLGAVGGFEDADAVSVLHLPPLRGGAQLIDRLLERRAVESSIARSVRVGKSALLAGLDGSIGGLADELRTIVRRVLLTRQLPASTLRALGLTHVRGLLLHGAPGTGKTLIARQLAKALNARPPKIVNGPELMNKYLGESERNIRALFEDARIEWEERGAESALHVIVFDELDAVARARGGGDGAGERAADAVVNQLLTLLDGVRGASNVLVVGLTNRLDLIDPALLRPGRLEVHVLIRAPDEAGRGEILRLLLRPPFEQGFLRVSEHELDQLIADLAARTDSFTGADLAGLVRNAASFALERASDDELSSENLLTSFAVERADYMRALETGSTRPNIL